MNTKKDKDDNESESESESGSDSSSDSSSDSGSDSGSESDDNVGNSRNNEDEDMLLFLAMLLAKKKKNTGFLFQAATIFSRPPIKKEELIPQIPPLPDAVINPPLINLSPAIPPLADAVINPSPSAPPAIPSAHLPPYPTVTPPSTALMAPSFMRQGDKVYSASGAELTHSQLVRPIIYDSTTTPQGADKLLEAKENKSDKADEDEETDTEGEQEQDVVDEAKMKEGDDLQINTTQLIEEINPITSHQKHLNKLKKIWAKIEEQNMTLEGQLGIYRKKRSKIQALKVTISRYKDTSPDKEAFVKAITSLVKYWKNIESRVKTV